ncbi:MAG: hypothetical protein ACKVOU_09685 [Cytophagales bacterium]
MLSFTKNIARMNNANVDETLLQMIEPKIKEIQEKFSRGEGLDSNDVNTLLLKLQFNHINHLDEKLNDVTADVSSLKGEFNGLKGEFNGLKVGFAGLRGEFKILETELKSEVKLIFAKFNSLESELKASKNAFESNIEFKIQKAINTNMRWSIGSIALLVVVLKLTDVLAAKLPNLL